MTAQEYAEYQQAVEDNLKHLSFVSTGNCEGCKDCDGSGDPHFSWQSCEACGSSLGGDRHPAHGRDANNEIVHFCVCADCLYFLNYGQLDDQTMMEIEEND